MNSATLGSGAGRFRSLDAYRGFVMLLLASDALGLRAIPVESAPAGPLRFVLEQTHHAAWAGCTAWDLVQPAFLFMVGLAMPYSYAARTAKGDSFGTQYLHALRRAAVLVALGVLLASNGKHRTEFVFDNVLAQIGLGYPVVFLLLPRTNAQRLSVAIFLLVGWWAAFALFPSSPSAQHWALHWGPHSNLAAAFDRWFLNLFPREAPVVDTEGGYQTLSFIPSMVNIIAGLVVADVLRTPTPAPADSLRTKLRWLVALGVASLLLGLGLHLLGVAPSIKRLWTSSFALLSVGWTVLLLAVFVAAVERARNPRFAELFVVVGVNSLAVYLLIELVRPWVLATLRTHGGLLLPASPLTDVAYLLFSAFLFWWVARWMHQRKLFLRI